MDRELFFFRSLDSYENGFIVSHIYFIIFEQQIEFLLTLVILFINFSQGNKQIEIRIHLQTFGFSHGFHKGCVINGKFLYYPIDIDTPFDFSLLKFVFFFKLGVFSLVDDAPEFVVNVYKGLRIEGNHVVNPNVFFLEYFVTELSAF